MTDLWSTGQRFFRGFFQYTQTRANLEVCFLNWAEPVGILAILYHLLLAALRISSLHHFDERPTSFVVNNIDSTKHVRTNSADKNNQVINLDISQI